MELIRQHDWYTSKPDRCFVDENDMDNSVIERILRNKFRDPGISSDSEDDCALANYKIDWSQVFQRRDNVDGVRRAAYVAGCRASPPYPRLSSLTAQQQFQCLKVLSAQNPNVLPLAFIPRPMHKDYSAFESLKEIYSKEQQEFIEWGKSLWASGHSQRALRPKPVTENVYEAEFKMRASSLQSFPKNFEMAAHISLGNKANKICVMNCKQDLVKVDIANLPKVDPHAQMLNKFTILGECSLPEPCNKHPCWFILPNEKEMSVLPLTEIHRELSQFAADNGSEAVASENALKCLAEMDTDWCIPVSVCEIVHLDGEKRNILVLGSDFSTGKKPAMSRTYRAFRHLLENALIPSSEKAYCGNKENWPTSSRAHKKKPTPNFFDDDDSGDGCEEDDWFGNLIINEDDDDESDEMALNLNLCDINNENIKDKNKEKESPKNEKTKLDKASEKQSKTNMKTKKTNGKESQAVKSDGFYTCSCVDTEFERPPQRSFRKYEVKNKVNNEKFNMIVHCSHKMKGVTGLEVIVEPIVEYQIDLGGSAQSDDKIKSLALSLFLRKNASLLNARIDSGTGEVITVDALSSEDLRKRQPYALQDVASVVYETVTQLQSLLPGHYILKHERAHGDNAFLYATRARGDGNKICLEFDSSVLAVPNEANTVKTPPVLTDVLLPVHKHRKVLPLSFTPWERYVAKEPRKPPARTRAPPHAIKWPKKKKKKTNKKKNQ